MAAVSNTFTAIAPKIIARGLKVLRPRLILSQVANKDYSTGQAQYGDTINVPVPWVSTPTAVSPNNVPPSPTGRTITTVPVVVDQWYRDDFALTDQDIQKINKDENFVPMGLDAVIDGLATKINQSLWANYYRYYNFVGDAGTTPFGSTYGYATIAKKMLSSNRCPKAGRLMVLNFEAEEKVTNLTTFAAVSASGDKSVITEGEIGRKLGFDWYADDDVPLHTRGSLTANVTVSGAHSAGVKSVLLATDGTGAIALKKGDIIYFGSATYPYSVQADLTVGASSTGTVTIESGLKAAVADAAAVAFPNATDYKFDASSRQNLAFHPSSLVFVSRTTVLSESDQLAGAKMMSLSDPVSGVTLRLELIREYKQTMWDIDALWGSAVHRPELGVRILGEST